VLKLFNLGGISLDIIVDSERIDKAKERNMIVLKGNKDSRLGPITLRSEDNLRSLRIKVKKITKKYLGDIGFDDLRMSPYSDKSELFDELRKYHDDLNFGTVVTILTYIPGGNNG